MKTKEGGNYSWICSDTVLVFYLFLITLGILTSMTWAWILGVTAFIIQKLQTRRKGKGVEQGMFYYEATILHCSKMITANLFL
ncbi:hypothetical protein TRIATDRAFT_299087, partial [Trichoderma atroviride IMI 206040]